MERDPRRGPFLFWAPGVRDTRILRWLCLHFERGECNADCGSGGDLPGAGWGGGGTKRSAVELFGEDWAAELGEARPGVSALQPGACAVADRYSRGAFEQGAGAAGVSLHLGACDGGEYRKPDCGAREPGQLPGGGRGQVRAGEAGVSPAQRVGGKGQADGYGCGDAAQERRREDGDRGGAVPDGSELAQCRHGGAVGTSADTRGGEREGGRAGEWRRLFGGRSRLLELPRIADPAAIAGGGAVVRDGTGIEREPRAGAAVFRAVPDELAAVAGYAWAED